jgi:hypothetical protein
LPARRRCRSPADRPHEGDGDARNRRNLLGRPAADHRVNIVLSGDNAVVIALAARSLPPGQQKQAVIWAAAPRWSCGSCSTIVAVELLRLPYFERKRLSILDIY